MKKQFLILRHSEAPSEMIGDYNYCSRQIIFETPEPVFNKHRERIDLFWSYFDSEEQAIEHAVKMNLHEFIILPVYST